MMERFEHQGYWWLPDRSEEKVPGTLTFDPDDGASLDLLGSLKGLEGTVDPLEPEIILGLSSEGKHITLKGCGKTRGTLRFGGGFSTSAFAVSIVFVGEHFERPEDVGFERLVVEYLHLEAWAHQSGIQPKLVEETEGPKRRWMEMRHDCPDPFTAVVGDEYEVILNFAAEFEHSPRPFTWASFVQPSEIAIEFPEKQSFDRLGDIVFRLQHLFSLGMRRPAYPVAVRGYTGSPGEAMPVEVHYRPLDRTNDVQRPELHEMLFSRRDLPGGFETTVGRWLEGAEKLDPVYRLFRGRSPLGAL
jgi:ApeA N-terminal domain 1